MKKFNFFLFILLAVTTVFTGCKKDDETNPIVLETPSYRTKIDPIVVNTLATLGANYNNQFFYDAKGDSTVDRREGQNLLSMFRAIDTYGKTGTTTELNATTLDNMFANTNAAFSGAYTSLNDASVNIKSVTATSTSDAIAIRGRIEGYFDSLANASVSHAETATDGQAGILENGAAKYLVDEKGIEWIQIISKSLIGAFQLDYIGNNLLNTGLNANNDALVSGKNYTALEHNWDVAYGVLTLKPRYAQDATASSNGGESFIGAYLWEYNKEGYKKIHEAFLRGRAAIINNDKATLKTQADLIRKEMEFAIANASLGYLKKWQDAGANNGAAAHALGEGGGFIYSLRFCKMHAADASFSEPLFSKILEKGHWEMTPQIAAEISNTIKAKFNIQ